MINLINKRDFHYCNLDYLTLFYTCQLVIRSNKIFKIYKKLFQCEIKILFFLFFQK
jgi:hypothetical protein